MADDQGSTSLPLVRANDNPHIAYPLMKDHLASAAFDLYSEYEPTGAFSLIAPDAEWAREPDNINGDSSIRARPDPSRQVRHDKDTQRESDNKDILDKQHAAFKRAHATLKKSIVASIGTDLCSAVAASHSTGFLRNCSALFIIKWLDAKYGTMQSKHVDQVLDTLAVTCKSSADFPAHSAHFSLTVRRLRAAEKLSTTTFVPNEQQLFTMLKQSFEHLPEFKKSMDAFNTSQTGMANQTFEKLATFLDDQESFIANQVAGTRFAGGAVFVGGMQVLGTGTAAGVTPSPAPAPAPAPTPARQKKRRSKKVRSASPGFDDGFAQGQAFAIQQAHFGYPVRPMHHFDPNIQPHHPHAVQQAQQHVAPTPTGPLVYCYVHGYSRSIRAHSGNSCRVMNPPAGSSTDEMNRVQDNRVYTEAMKRATRHTDCPGGSQNNLVPPPPPFSACPPHLPASQVRPSPPPPQHLQG